MTGAPLMAVDGKPRELRFEDLEFRADAKPAEGSNRTRFVPYLKAHSVTTMFDEWCGPLNWKSHFETIIMDGKEMVRCYISVARADLTSEIVTKVNDGSGGVSTERYFKNEWVTKEDVGAYPEMAGESSKANERKGGISDALKRCASRQWGIGRRVYDLETVWAPCKDKGYPTDETLPDIARQYGGMFPWLDGVEEFLNANQTRAAGRSAAPDAESFEGAAPAKPRTQQTAKQRVEKPLDVAEARKIGSTSALFRMVKQSERTTLTDTMSQMESSAQHALGPFLLFPFPSRSKMNELDDDIAAQWEADTQEAIIQWLVTNGVIAA